MKKQTLTYFLIFCVMASLHAQSVKEIKRDAFGYLWAGNYESAKSGFDKIITASTTNADIYLGRGTANYYLDRQVDALADFKRAAEQGLAEAFLWEARILAQGHLVSETAEAIAAFLRENPVADRKAIRKDPAFKFLYTSDEWLLLWQEEPEDELAATEAELRYYLSRKNYRLAHQLIEDQFQVGNKELKLYQLNAEVYEKEGNLQLALNEINYALSSYPDSDVLLLMKAEYLALLNENEKAYHLMDRLVQSDYLNFDYLLKRAHLGLQCNYLDQAEEDIRTIMRYSDSPEHIFLAGKIAYAQGDYVEALKAYNALLAEDDANSEYLKARGKAYYRTRTYKQAAYDLSMSLDLNPNDPETNYYKGLSEKALGDISMACYYMEKAAKQKYLPAIEFQEKNCSGR